MQQDSVDKIVQHYFACITKKPFSYKGVEYVPRPLRVTSDLLRGYTCPAGCGGCCFNVSLDWIPSESMPGLDPSTKREYEFERRTITISGKRFEVLSDMQRSNSGKHCKHRMENGRCAIHFDGKPMAAEFELIRFLIFTPPRPNVLTTKLFGRGWSYERVDGGKGALCEIVPSSPEVRADVVYNLKRLKNWAEYFEIEHVLDRIISWIEEGDWGVVPKLLLNEEFSDDYHKPFN